MVQEAHGAQVLLDPDYRPKNVLHSNKNTGVCYILSFIMFSPKHTAAVLVSLLCPKLIQNFIIPSPTLNSLQYHHKQIGSKIDTLQILALKLPRK